MKFLIGELEVDEMKMKFRKLDEFGVDM
jgi:hypothetical protein